MQIAFRRVRRKTLITVVKAFSVKCNLCYYIPKKAVIEIHPIK